MASEFIGLAVLITLKDPANTRLHGTIVNIINKDLVLANGNISHVLSPLYNES